jgi:uncharacterized protein (TIRG00374 family)
MRRRIALHTAATAVTVVLLALLARTVDWGEAWRAVRGASLPLLLAAAAVNLVTVVAKGVRWWIFLRAAGAPSLRLAVRSTVAGSGLNNILPASGGEAARVLFVRRAAGVSSATVVATLALDRLTDVLSFLGLLALAPLVGALPAVLRRWSGRAEVALAIVLPMLAALAWLARRRHGPRAAAAASAPATPRRTLRAWMGRLGVGLTTLPTASRLLPALALSLVAWAAQVATYHLAARAAGLPVSVLASGAAVVAVNLAFLLQLTPGSVGVFQVLYALVMSAFGVSRHAAVGVALLIQALQIAPVTALAIALAPDLALRRRPLPEEAATGEGELPRA